MTVFDLSQKQKRQVELEELTKGEDFWQDQEKAGGLSRELSGLNDELGELQAIEKQIGELEELVVIAEDDKITAEIAENQKNIKKRLKELLEDDTERDPYDEANAIIQIAAGAGGVDAQDWAEMLFRMYLRFTEQAGLKASVISVTAGTEAGIKSATIEVKGKGAFAKLKKEAGVHRLVRLSPYNAKNLRQTSFALVEVMPEVLASEVVLEEKDLKVDTFRASGAGGQHVNKTDSAVRLTHLPTNIVVSCQSERSQAQNKEKARKILMGKLYLLGQEKQKEKERELKGEHQSAEWGNQIRSYVLHPYKMVKNHLSGKKTNKVEEVLNGDLELVA